MMKLFNSLYIPSVVYSIFLVLLFFSDDSWRLMVHTTRDILFIYFFSWDGRNENRTIDNILLLVQMGKHGEALRQETVAMVCT